jgi:hypothetical protein
MSAVFGAGERDQVRRPLAGSDLDGRGSGRRQGMIIWLMLGGSARRGLKGSIAHGWNTESK